MTAPASQPLTLSPLWESARESMAHEASTVRFRGATIAPVAQPAERLSSKEDAASSNLAWRTNFSDTEFSAPAHGRSLPEYPNKAALVAENPFLRGVIGNTSAFNAEGRGSSPRGGARL